jgi:hypothetical protein
MTELELLRREFDEVPEPDEASTELARAALRVEIEASAPVASTRFRRRWLRPLTGIAIVAAATAILLVLVGPFGSGPARVDVASAAYAAFSPSRSGIWHVVVVQTQSFQSPGAGMSVARVRDETWSTTGAPHVLRVIGSENVPGLPSRVEQVFSRCGWLYYSADTNVLQIAGPEKASATPVSPPPDPAASYRQAYKSGQVVYQGRTTFAGIPAYKLVVHYRHGTYAATTTFIVRQDNYYPLQTSSVVNVSGRTGTDVLTYTTYELLPSTAANERLLRLAPHPHMLIVPSLRSKPMTNPTCAKYVKPRLRP